MAKDTNPKSIDIFTRRRLEKQKEVDEAQKEEQEIKRPSTRGSKTLHPRGAGKRNIGRFR